MASNVPLQFVWCCEGPFTPFLRTLKLIKKALIWWRNPTGWPFVMICNMAWTFDFAGEILWSGGRSRRGPNPAYIVYMFNMTRPTGWRKKGDCPPTHHVVLMSSAPLSTFPPWGGGGVTWANFCWVCSSGLLEPLPHYSLLCGHIIDPSFFYSHFGKKVILAIPFSSLSV